jgi:hypothetical protein
MLQTRLFSRFTLPVFFLFSSALFGFCPAAQANNLTISNVSLENRRPGLFRMHRAAAQIPALVIMALWTCPVMYWS